MIWFLLASSTTHLWTLSSCFLRGSWRKDDHWMVLSCHSTPSLPSSTPTVPVLLSQQPLHCHPHGGEKIHLMEKQLLVFSHCHIWGHAKSPEPVLETCTRHWKKHICWLWPLVSLEHCPLFLSRLSTGKDVTRGWQAVNNLVPLCARGETLRLQEALRQPTSWLWENNQLPLCFFEWIFQQVRTLQEVYTSSVLSTML